MKITIEFSMDSDAFEDDLSGHEIFSALRKVEDVIRVYTVGRPYEYRGRFEHTLFDSNGNAIGTVKGEA